MKKIITYFIALLAYTAVSAQTSFSDNFESYTVNSYLGPQSSDWTTWSGADGSSEDVFVVNTNSSSGSNSIYFNSPFGGGPNDVVLPFGGLHTSGRFKFSANIMVPTNKGGYFNFQGGSSIGTVWSMELYLRTYGAIDIYGGGYFSGSYPQGRWFKLTIDADLDNDLWTVLIDGAVIGSFTNSLGISYLDIYPADWDSEYWMDDIEYCVNSACNPELSLDALSISPSTVCTYNNADVTFHLTNNSSFSAPEFTLALDIGTNRITRLVKLNNLAGGRDTTITIPGLFNSSVAGPNVSVKAINLQGDVDASNDTAKTTVTVNKSPSNIIINKATPFTTTRPLSSGTGGDPDVVAPGDVLSYNIDPPSGYTNSGYGSTWNITGFTMKTSTGRTISNSYYTYTTPGGSANAKFSFSPDTLLRDSTIIVSFTVRDPNTTCDSSLSRIIYVAPRPKAGFSSPNVCDKVTVAFTNNTTIASGQLTYLWDFGDGTTSNLSQPTKLYSAPGTYNVKLWVNSGYDYADSITLPITIYPIPVPNFEFTNECEGTALTFKDISTLPPGTPTFDWNFGSIPASSATGATTSKLYADPGIYNVTLKVTVNGCAATTSKFVTQAPRAIPSFNFTPTQCDNSDVDFTNTSTDPAFGHVSYLWKLGDGDEATTPTVTHTYNNFRVYDVVLVANTDLGCADSITKQVTLRQSPTAAFTNTNAKCSHEDITFTNGSTVPAGFTNTYEWDFGDGNTSATKDPVHQYIAPGDYTIVLKSYSDNGCTSTTESMVSINLNPNADFVPENVCKGEDLTLGNNSYSPDDEPLNYVWNFGNGNTSVDVNPTVVYNTAGTYDVTLEAKHSVNGCVNTITKQVTVYELPVADINAASRNTNDGAMNFTTNATGAGYTYLWYFGDGGTSRAKDTTYIFNNDGVMKIKLVVTSGDGCVSIADGTVNINRLGVNNINGITNAVKVYPNPSTGKFVVDFSNAAVEDIKNVTVTDVMGRMIASHIAISDAGFAHVDLTAYATGIYYLNVETAQGSHTIKISITK